MAHHVELLILLAAMLHASWNALLRGGVDRFRSGALISFFAGVTGLSVVGFVPLPLPASWGFIIASSFLHLVYNLLLIWMYEEGDFSHAYPIARGASPLLVAIGALVWAGEKAGFDTWAGIALISTGILALSTGGHLRIRGVIAALLTGCCIAAYSLVDGMGVRVSGNAVSYTAWMVVGYGLAMPLVFRCVRRQPWRALWDEAPSRLFLLIVGGFISIAGYGIVVWAMETNHMGPVSALRETSVLFAVVIGWLFLHEKLTLRKIASATFIMIGAILLRLF